MKSSVKVLVIVTCCTIVMYFLQNITNIKSYFEEIQAENEMARILSAQRNNGSGFKYDIAEKISDPEHKFRRVYMKGVFILHNVCIEPDPHHRKVEVQKRLNLGTHLDMKRNVLVVYNAHHTVTNNHKVGAHSNVRVRDWEVMYRTDPMPKGVTVIDSHDAYFMTTSCDGNLWLFFEDTLRGLYTVINKTNRLHSKEKNIVYYREPLWEYNKLLEKYVQCWDPFR